EICAAETPFGDLVTAQCVCERERVFLRKGQRCVSRNGFVDEEQADTPALIIQKGPADRQLALCAQPIRVCKMGRAGAGDPVQVSVFAKVDELHGVPLSNLVPLHRMWRIDRPVLSDSAVLCRHAFRRSAEAGGPAVAPGARTKQQSGARTYNPVPATRGRVFSPGCATRI